MSELQGRLEEAIVDAYILYHKAQEAKGAEKSRLASAYEKKYAEVERLEGQLMEMAK